MILPFGGESEPDMVLPSQALPPLNPFAEADAPRVFGYYEGLTCIDRAGVGRERHAWDKDARCVFCDRRRLNSKWRT